MNRSSDQLAQGEVMNVTHLIPRFAARLELGVALPFAELIERCRTDPSVEETATVSRLV
jgi:hypothetical protein